MVKLIVQQGSKGLGSIFANKAQQNYQPFQEEWHIAHPDVKETSVMEQPGLRWLSS